MLGNDQIVPELLAQMKGTFPDPDRSHARQFRDGLPYQHNLAAVRAVMDSQTPSAWNSNTYMKWLGALQPPVTPQPNPLPMHGWAAPGPGPTRLGLAKRTRCPEKAVCVTPRREVWTGPRASRPGQSVIEFALLAIKW